MPKPPAEFSPLMTSEVDGVGFKDVGEMFADDVAAGGAKTSPTKRIFTGQVYMVVRWRRMTTGR